MKNRLRTQLHHTEPAAEIRNSTTASVEQQLALHLIPAAAPTTPERARTAPPVPAPGGAATRGDTRSTEFIKIEKNLASLGFFTPSNKRISGEKKKVVHLSRDMNGKRMEARATILPSAQYGLPTTADQDTYLAILKLATDIHRRQGRISNPVGFTSAEILRIQGKSCVSGYHYKELHEQLMRIKTATILSEGAVYFAGRKVWAKDAFNVINRLVLFGTQMDDGSVAEKHFVWFSDWQLENINNNYLLPIDYDSYKRLKNHIAKILVPLLQIWLYASRENGYFEKRYQEICQFLNIREYQHLSKIKEKLGPSLNELTANGYLSGWAVDKTVDGCGYKVILRHGEKFRKELTRRITARSDVAPRARASVIEKLPAGEGKSEKISGLVEQLTRRGIRLDRARAVAETVTDEGLVVDQLEWGDHLIAQNSGATIYNPPGFYLYLIKSNAYPPDTFETTRRRRRREEMKREQTTGKLERIRMELEYEDYRKAQVEAHLTSHYTDETYAIALAAKKQEMRQLYRETIQWRDEAVADLARARLRGEIAKGLPLMGFEEFCRQRSAPAKGA